MTITEESATIENQTPNAERFNYTQQYPVRIAHIIGKLRNGGVESVVMNYYRNIDREKIQYDFIIDDDSENPELQSEIVNLGGKVITVPAYQKQFAYQKALHELFRENNYLLVYSHINTLSVFPLFAAWRAGIKIRVAHNHSTAGGGELKRNIMKYSLRPFAKVFPTHLCACSKFAGEWLFGKSAMNSGRVKVWPNAIDTSRFAYNESIRNDIRRELKLEGKFVVGHAGRFVQTKNHDFLIDIFNEIHKRRSDSVLLLAGDGPLMDSVKDKVFRLGLNDSVIFMGDVHGMGRYYQAMDIFILPSLYEGLGMVAVEAQVSGLPVLCSDEVPNEAVICNNIKFLSLKRSAGEWADESLRFSENHVRCDMSDAAREHGFDIREQALKLQEWYCGLLGI